MEKQSYKIYILNYSARRWTPICSVSDTATIIKMPTESLQNLMDKICNNIIYLETLYYMPEDYKRRIIAGEYKNDILEFTFLGDFRWRHGTVYYGVQYSRKTKNVRILLFGTDNVHHSGAGTNPINQPIDEIYDSLTEELIKFDSNTIDQLDVSPEVKIAFRTGKYTIGI